MEDSKIRNYLPRKYAKIIHDRIQEKFGDDFTPAYIVMVVNGKRTNSVIMQEAAILAAEEKDRVSQTAIILDSL